MTDNEINIAIAEVCGWTCLGQVEGCKPHGYPPNARKPTTEELLEGYGSSPWDVPDYCNDLNAMHVAEKVLTSLVEQLTYLNKLSPIKSEWTLATSTARQRAEAFLRTLNLWR